MFPYFAVFGYNLISHQNAIEIRHRHAHNFKRRVRLWPICSMTSSGYFQCVDETRPGTKKAWAQKFQEALLLFNQPVIVIFEATRWHWDITHVMLRAVTLRTTVFVQHTASKYFGSRRSSGRKFYQKIRKLLFVFGFPLILLLFFQMFQVIQPNRALYIQTSNCVEHKEWLAIYTVDSYITIYSRLI